MSDFAGFDVGARIGVWRVSGFLGGGLTGEVYLVDEAVAPFRRGALKYCRFADDGHRKKFSDEIDIAEARPVPGALGGLSPSLCTCRYSPVSTLTSSAFSGIIWGKEDKGNVYDDDPQQRVSQKASQDRKRYDP